ncbi:dihydrofolate reductase [Winogradskyella ursingii]|uniref:dihydrofolate reductase n=1 Tax=Winogradskyella ursingii TaxID=2686079 RepID=UPI0015C8B2C8|nr:dihydrofolate reductase [Winogradskyella ursingii]
MFGKKKQTSTIDKDQLELIENAQKRIKQKKRLYIHFVIFLIGAVFLILANTVLGIGENFKIAGIDWFVYAIVAWLFLFIYHFINVFITHKFMGKEWEKQQLDKLVDQQKKRIEKLKKQLPVKESPANQNQIAPSDVVSSGKKKPSGLTMIVAAGENNAIGKDNDLIWHLRDDLKRFKSLTSGHHIIMGRKTYESFAKPLPNRTHVVITRQPNYKAPIGVIVVHNLEDALDAARADDQPFIIGGGEIYKQAMPFARKIELTRVHASFDNADTFFPEIDTSQWEEVTRTKHESDGDHAFSFSFITYLRK